MVQYMGNTFKSKRHLSKVLDALERELKNGSENRIRNEGRELGEFHGSVSGIWNQPEDGI